MKFFKLVFLLFFFVIFINTQSSAIIKSNIVLKIENEIITNYEIKNKIITTLVLSNEEVNQENINKLKRQTLDLLIIHKLRKLELSKYNLVFDNNHLISYLNKISSNNIQKFKEKFKSNNIDYNLYLDEIETQLRWQQLIYKIYSNKIVIDENSIDEEVNKLVNNKSNILEYKLSEIEIISENDSVDRKKILNIKEQISINGFKSTAMKFSSSSSASSQGDLGWVNPDLISKPIAKILKSLKKGDVSPPIKKQNSIIFLMLDDIRIIKSNNVDKKKIKEEVIKQKKNDLFNLYSNSHLSKIKNNSLIQYK